MRLLQSRVIPKVSRPHFGVRETILLVTCVLVMGVGVAHLGTRILLYEATENQFAPTASFPVGVDPAHKRIVENPEVESYFTEHISTGSSGVKSHTSWIRGVLAKLALNSWYQHLASPTSRILVILSGERKEEVAEHFSGILGWDKIARRAFMERVASSSPVLAEGKFAPHTYLTTRGASPEDVAALVTDQFQKDTLSRYSTSTAAVVPLQDALTIASLLEREGNDFEDMRYISGIIWKRLFDGMNLQIDATLQYVKGSEVNQPWWPQVVPADKQRTSAFNTYTHAGLPPAPIANPSLDAILAALNPKNTDCMFYFHDADGGFHCSVTYTEHVVLLKQYYGRGR